MGTKHGDDATSMTGRCPGCGMEGPALAPCPLRSCRADGLHHLPPGGAPRTRAAGVGQRVGPWVMIAGWDRDAPSVTEALDRPEGGAVTLVIVPAGQRQAVAVLEREAEVATELDHPAILGFTALGRDDGFAWGARAALVGGRTLAQELGERRLTGRRFTRDEAGALLDGLTEVMAAAHRRRRTHLNLSPDDIVLAATAPRVRVQGFGRVAPQRPGGGAQSLALRLTPYQPLEQVAGGDRVNPAADLYAVAAVMYEVLTLRRPFASGPGMFDAKARVHEDIDCLADGEPLPHALAVFFQRALHPEPTERFPDAHALRGALRDALAGQVARPEPGPRRAQEAAPDAPEARRERREPTRRPTRRVDPEDEVAIGRTMEIEHLRAPEEADPQAWFSPENTMDLGGFAPRKDPRRRRPSADDVAPAPPARRPQPADEDATLVLDRYLPGRDVGDQTMVLGRAPEPAGRDDATVLLGRAQTDETQVIAVPKRPSRPPAAPEGAGDATLMLDRYLPELGESDETLVLAVPKRPSEDPPAAPEGNDDATVMLDRYLSELDETDQTLLIKPPRR